MTKSSKTEVKKEKATARADEALATIRAKAERKIAKIKSDLVDSERKINGRLEKILRKSDAKLKKEGAERFAQTLKRARKVHH
jgi:hypothetical protein